MVYTKSFEKVRSDVEQDFRTRTFKIAIRPEDPFVMKRERDENNELIPDERSEYTTSVRLSSSNLYPYLSGLLYFRNTPYSALQNLGSTLLLVAF